MSNITVDRNEIRDHFLQLTSGMTQNWQLGVDSLQLPSLPPEKCSMTGLHLLQQLYKLFKFSDVKPCDPTKVTPSWNDFMMSCSLWRGWGEICRGWLVRPLMLVQNDKCTPSGKMFTQWYLPSIVCWGYPVFSARKKHLISLQFC